MKTKNENRRGSARAKAAHAIGMNRAGDPTYPDHKPSDKQKNAMFGARRWEGDSKYTDRPGPGELE